jgi:lipid biosynthesis B12-binding/radical SAM protein
MSRILLISSNIIREPFPVYPLGMAIIASSLNAAGHIVEQYDFLKSCDDTTGKDILKIISKFAPDFIGISIRNIDNVDSLATSDNWYLKHVNILVKSIKQNTNIPVIIGGPAFSIMPEKILEITDADYGIAGEGEITLVKLIADLSDGKSPQKITYFNEKLIDGCDFVVPLYTKELASYYIDKSGMLNYQTKRGCPHGCNYCSYPVIEGRKFRKQEPGFVADNLKRLKNDFDFDTLFFTDSVFNDSNGHYLEVAEEMVRQECNIKWAGYFRPDKISDSELKLLKKSGLYAMEVGSDAACDTTLKGINKSFLFEDVLEFNRQTTKHEIPAANFFMFGGPGESKKTVDESLNNIEKLEKCVVFIFSGIRILPQTGIRDIAITDGIISREDDLLKPVYYISPLIDKKEMEGSIIESFGKRKDRIFPPEKGQIRSNVMHTFGFKGLIWDMLLTNPTTERKVRRKRVKNMV